MFCLNGATWCISVVDKMIIMVYGSEEIKTLKGFITEENEFLSGKEYEKYGELIPRRNKEEKLGFEQSLASLLYFIFGFIVKMVNNDRIWLYRSTFSRKRTLFSRNDV